MFDTHEEPGPAEALQATPDLSGMTVHDTDDLRIGHVFGVLSDADTGLMRFLDVALEAEPRHILVPIGHARVVRPFGKPRLRLRAASVGDLEEIPTYHAGDDAFEEARRGEVLAAHGRLFRGDRYYAHPAYDHRGLYAGAHPIARVRESPPGIRPLSLLRDSEFDIAQDQPDVIGWSVFTGAGEEVGSIEDLVIDPNAEEVRYVVVALASGTSVLLPIGYVEIDPVARTVIVPGLEAADFNAIPPFEGLPLTRVQETALREILETLLDARNPFLRVDFSGRELFTEE